MKAFFDIISFSTGCLFWGILIGIICMVLFFLLIKGWYKHAEASPATYLVGGILFILLSTLIPQHYSLTLFISA